MCTWKEPYTIYKTKQKHRLCGSKSEPPDKFTSNFFFRKTGASFPIHFIKFCSMKISLMLGSRCSTSNLRKKEMQGLETVLSFQQKQVGTPIFFSLAYSQVKAVIPSSSYITYLQGQHNFTWCSCGSVGNHYIVTVICFFLMLPDT